MNYLSLKSESLLSTISDRYIPQCFQDSASPTAGRASAIRRWRSTVTTTSWKRSPLPLGFHYWCCRHYLLQLLLKVLSHLQGLCQSLKTHKQLSFFSCFKFLFYRISYTLMVLSRSGWTQIYWHLLNTYYTL